MIPWSEILIRLAVAGALGSIIGSERQKHEWAAGLRTHMLVCIGAALIMIVSTYGFEDVLGKKGVALDPSRVAAQVVSGIGFLGAGTILFLRGEVVRGLTTAAGLWTVAAIGLAVGGGLYFAAGATTVIAFIILAVLKPLETKFFNKNKAGGISMVLERKMISLEHIQDVLKSHGIKYSEIKLSPSLEEDLDEIKISLQKNTVNKDNSLILMEDLRKVKGVREVNLIVA